MDTNQHSGGARGSSHGHSRNAHRGGPSASRGHRPHSRPFSGRNQNRGRGFSANIHPSKFVHKAAVTEKIDIFVPEHSFADFPVDARLKANIVAKGYVTPTPIQDKSIMDILRGSDLVGIANTGTGKTAAFLIPLIHKIILDPKQRALIVVPTRELAQQIESELKGFAARLNMYAVCCVGGANIVQQMRALSRSHNLVIGTPGRLKDLIERGRLPLNQFSTLVLDEADRMLDMGFIGDIKFMVSQMPKERQTLFFSATMSREIELLIKDFLKNPVSVSVRTGETAASVDGDVVSVPPGKDKLDILCDMLKQPGFDKVLIFGRTKHGVERLSRTLESRGFAAQSIHGNKNQNQRMKALSLFKTQHAKILVATDVAARGLDIAGVSHVINFDLPSTYEDYIHRIGRTGRAGLKGKALTFLQ